MEEKGDPDSEPVPGWWPQSNVWLSAECTLKDVKCLFFSLSFSLSLLYFSFLLSVSFFFLFDLTISLFLPPDCIRIDCSLSKWFYPFFWLKCIRLSHPDSVLWRFLLCPVLLSLPMSLLLHISFPLNKHLYFPINLFFPLFPAWFTCLSSVLFETSDLSCIFSSP